MLMEMSAADALRDMMGEYGASPFAPSPWHARCVFFGMLFQEFPELEGDESVQVCADGSGNCIVVSTRSGKAFVARAEEGVEAVEEVEAEAAFQAGKKWICAPPRAQSPLFEE